MGVPYSNMKDIIYCHEEEVAKELFEFFKMKGYPVGLSSSVIITGTNGQQVVNKLDIYKKEEK